MLAFALRYEKARTRFHDVHLSARTVAGLAPEKLIFRDAFLAGMEIIEEQPPRMKRVMIELHCREVESHQCGEDR